MSSPEFSGGMVSAFPGTKRYVFSSRLRTSSYCVCALYSSSSSTVRAAVKSLPMLTSVPPMHTSASPAALRHTALGARRSISQSMGMSFPAASYLLSFDLWLSVSIV